MRGDEITSEAGGILDQHSTNAIALDAIEQGREAWAPCRSAAPCAREVKGKLGGRKPLVETKPEVVELAQRLRTTRSGKQRSLREISVELSERGFVADSGKPYEATQVSRMLASPFEAAGEVT